MGNNQSNSEPLLCKATRRVRFTPDLEKARLDGRVKVPLTNLENRGTGRRVCPMFEHAESISLLDIIQDAGTMGNYDMETVDMATKHKCFCITASTTSR